MDQKEIVNYWDLPKSPENAKKRLRLAMDKKVLYEHYKIYRRIYSFRPMSYKDWLDMIIN